MTNTQKPLFAPIHSKHHWPEDFKHENGNYFCKCNTCGADFVGHKRRVQCKSCFVTAVVAERDQLKRLLKEAIEWNWIDFENEPEKEIFPILSKLETEIQTALEKHIG